MSEYLLFALFLIFPAAMVFAGSMDLFTMTIPNRISIGMIIGFLVAAPFSSLGWQGFLWHLAAGATMLAIGILMFAQGWLGGGDAKLLAAATLWLGFERLFDYLGVQGDEPDLPVRIGTLRRKGNMSELADILEVGEPTLIDILEDLAKPGRDPRDDLPAPLLRQDVLKMEDLREGMVLSGTVRNVVSFGAFVDIGVKQDGLVHISQLADRYVKDPGEVAKVQDRVEVTVLEVDVDRRRISLSMRRDASPPAHSPAPAPAPPPAGKKGKKVKEKKGEKKEEKKESPGEDFKSKLARLESKFRGEGSGKNKRGS